jgi:LPXTG-motif cell wall-anchored protein
MPQDPEQIHQEVQHSPDRLGEADGGGDTQEGRHEDARGTAKQKVAKGKDAIVESVSERKEQVVSKISEKLPDPGSMSDVTAGAKQRVVQVKEKAQVLRTRAAKATRRVPPAAKPAGLAVGAALTGSLGLLLRRRRKETRTREHALREGKWGKVALGLGALLLIGRKIRSGRRRS